MKLVFTYHNFFVCIIKRDESWVDDEHANYQINSKQFCIYHNIKNNIQQKKRNRIIYVLIQYIVMLMT